ncbi:MULTISPECIES: signal peptidase I [Tsukamurella]|uniref:Signal peptidase I n=1 Tax=Tsukamurella strandjordii TaxID=147577 RepID=A0AA90NI98_9ACTN|nr:MULTISPECIES: signal peptidase I [Tsukamurella]MDP0398876.1 signal peptidase I [Tsukamurella strandjordii]
MPEQTNSQETPEPDDSTSAGGSSVSGAEEPARHAAPAAVAGDADEKKQKKTNWPLEVAVVLVVALVLSFCLQTFVGRQWYVPSESMEPTLIGCEGCTGDRIVTQKISYFTGDPQPGDVIVFKGPTTSWGMEPVQKVRSDNTLIRGVQEALSYVGLQPPNENDLVKRVIAVGGQTIECKPGTGLTVNGKKLNEPYLEENAKRYAAANQCWPMQRYDGDTGAFGPITVPQGNVFMMGDNRLFSRDSRYHIEDELQGTVPKADIRGKVAAIIYPFSRWQTVKAINPQQG